MTLRVVRPQDRDLLQAMVKRLSSESRRYRFHSVVNELTCKTLESMTLINPTQQMAYVVTTPCDGHECILADGRYVISGDFKSAEFSIVVQDSMQRCGIGQRVMRKLLVSAKYSGLYYLMGDVMCSNSIMIAFAKSCGFELVAKQGDCQTVRAQKHLGSCQASDFPAKNGVIPTGTVAAREVVPC
jgi:acetyltransferase